MSVSSFETSRTNVDKDRGGNASARLDEMFLEAELAEHAATFERLSRSLAPAFWAALELLESGLRAGGKVVLFGNGGSAADAQHLAVELVIRYAADRPAIAAIALTTDSSCLTACGNDIGFDSIFARQIEAIGRPE